MNTKTRLDAFIYTSKTEARECPVCHRQLDGATGVSLDPSDRQPTLALDSVTCCAYCGTILVVTTIGFRLATDEDLADVEPKLRGLLFEYARQHIRPS